MVTIPTGPPPVLILTPSDLSLGTADGPTAPLSWVRSGDGRQALEHGSCAASLLPAEAEVVLALPVRALSWHRLAVPKVAASRLRAVLDGLLEERLLSDTTELHFALEPGARTGQTLWVAACDKAWLRSWLQALEAAGRPASRIVPMLWPSADAVHWAHDSGGHAWLGSASAEGVRCLPLAAVGTDHTAADATEAQWLADPAVAAAAEQALDRRLAPVPLHDWLLRVAQSDWNLAQFDLSLSSGARRGQRLRQALRQFRTAPAWRPARWGPGRPAGGPAAGAERGRLARTQQPRRQAPGGTPDIATNLSERDAGAGRTAANAARAGPAATGRRPAFGTRP